MSLSAATAVRPVGRTVPRLHSSMGESNGNSVRFDQLRALTPTEAVQAWLDFAFGFDDEPALLEAIRKDSRVRLSDKEITDAIRDAMDNELNAQECLERLVKSP